MTCWPDPASGGWGCLWQSRTLVRGGGRCSRPCALGGSVPTRDFCNYSLQGSPAGEKRSPQEGGGQGKCVTPARPPRVSHKPSNGVPHNLPATPRGSNLLPRACPAPSGSHNQQGSPSPGLRGPQCQGPWHPTSVGPGQLRGWPHREHTQGNSKWGRQGPLPALQALAWVTSEKLLDLAEPTGQSVKCRWQRPQRRQGPAEDTGEALGAGPAHSRDSASRAVMLLSLSPSGRRGGMTQLWPRFHHFCL